jgi:ABC-type nitrate/sulfonate/bicarbonate transport system substrate-binding protein
MAAVAVVALAGCGGAAPISSAVAPAASASATGSAAANTSPGSASATGSAAANASPGSVSAGGSAVAKTSAAAGAAVRMGASQNITTNAPVWLTSQQQLFQKNGLTVDLQSISSTTGIKQMVAGQLDGLVAGAPESISAKAAGAPIQIVAVLQTACDMELVVPNDITSATQLKGKTVAVITKASVVGICAVADLRHQGLQPDTDYKLVETGSAGTYGAVVAALQSGNVQAGPLQPDFAHQLEKGGQFHSLYDMATKPDLLTAASSVTFSTAFVQAHPDQVQKTLDTILQGEAYFKQHKDDSENLLKTMFKISDPAQLDETYTRQGQLMAKDITPRPELFPDMVAALAQVEPDVKNVDLNSLLVQSFAKSAMDRGLTNF